MKSKNFYIYSKNNVMLRENEHTGLMRAFSLPVFQKNKKCHSSNTSRYLSDFLN